MGLVAITVTEPPVSESAEDDVAERFRRAIGEFNCRHFFECHETLEAIWIEDVRSHERRFFQGILQVAVGLLHLSNLNHRGATNLLERGCDKLERFRPQQYGVDVDRLLRDARACREAVTRLGKDRLEQFDRALIPTIELGDLRALEEDWREV